MAADPARTRAVLGVVAAVSMWGVSPAIIKGIGASGLVVAFYRLWLALPLVWLLVATTPGLRRELDAHWVRASLAGGALFGLHQVFFFNAIKLTSIATVTMVGALQPAVVLVLAGWLFGEAVTRRALGWSALAFLGIAPVMVGAMAMPARGPLGDVLAFLNLGAFTAYFLASKRFRERVGAWTYVAGMTSVAAVVVAVACVATGQDLGSPSGTDWLLLLFLGALPGTVGHVLTNWAHAHAPAFLVSMLLLLAPVISVAIAAAALGESIGILQMLGAALVIGAISMVVTASSDPEALAEAAAETDSP